ncbi:hypothetical protein DNH61_17100 [Paenibacillus sambharensis]|uniref:Uncharacterized protein n=1 Tax=Paenibacillus sambharensis TaxID=1803190 RepID=A0A2W1L781_9BACL|nr:hypothetical protein [Paenibacillus sambharensis]PZD94669.1 hypothetical protein DNH61_17100 [Paenibacillus sambharensis]
MATPIMALDDFLKLSADEQVEQLKRYKVDYNLKDIREAWGFKHSAQYYMLLKKLRIYDRVVNKSDKFYPDQLLGDRGADQRSVVALPVSEPAKPREDHFAYELNITLQGDEVAGKLERIAQFLKGEQKRVSVKLLLEVQEQREEESGEKEAAAGSASEEEQAQ